MFAVAVVCVERGEDRVKSGSPGVLDPHRLSVE